MEPYKKFLSSDPKLREALKTKVKLPKLRRNIANKLVASILAQQLSVRVAQVMHERFLDLFGGKEPTPEQILKVSVLDLRAIGISMSKATYIHNVAAFVLEHKITDRKLHKMSDDEIIELLTQIKGVGRWTVEMLLIFALGREDVFAVDDLGVQQGMKRIFRLNHLKGKKLRQKMAELSLPWSPYRSYVCLHFWNYQG